MTNAEPKGHGLKWKGLTKTEYGYKRRCGGKDGYGVQEKTAAAQRRHTRPKGHGLARKKRTKKLNTDISARRGQKAKRSGRQALAERAASEAKFVLIAERKTQEEA